MAATLTIAYPPGLRARNISLTAAFSTSSGSP